ncbi:MAG TPA: GSCFA domain-containing protein [Flavobacterium sp.]|uniref:GSCFA domain-containing protein n=1 Tax=Flavobacterium sp. TaxID=239 RepID=UPI002B52E990|nr:GSCFA domain-containing protein [Flavobacterium sp.]HNP33610.1 GSCFA domain-containing protein [Flavobacterium sp.]
MNFTTKIPISKANNPISYDSKIVSLGSCFAENMGEKFSYFKFQNTVNPFGIIFNPVSIENLVSRVVNKQKFTEEDIFFHNDLWHCFEVHSELSNPNKEVFLKNLNQLLESTNNQVTQSTHIIITYGTSWVYQNKTSGKIVANCHKVPQSQFEKDILSIETIENSIRNTIDLIRKINPNCSFIFTVSPVRHIKDGFVENQRSKAHLIAALHTTINRQSTTKNYFPSYEIMMDELRDYRFYAEDMLHPSPTAIDYIWKLFFENYIAEENHSTMEEVCNIQKSLLHRPFNPDSENHQKFLTALNQKITKLQQQFPYFKF